MRASRPDGDVLDSAGEEPLLTGFGKGEDGRAADGAFIGLMRTSAAGTRKVRAVLEAMRQEGSLAGAELGAALSRLAESGERIAVVYVRGDWHNINDLMDLAQARDEV